MNESPQSPRVLGNRYEVGDLLGRGGMAEVHLGRDTRLGRVVAIKLLRTDLARDPMFQARFRREAQSAAGLNHPAIVAVYDTGEETIFESGGSGVSLPYIVMEYVEGRTLRDVLREGRPMEVQQALEVTAGVLSALDYSHRMGIVHRDIKPANVMLNANGDVKVMDFGIARALADVSATMTQTQAVIGTAQYLSPEQARGETVDARSDLYSAGCLLFELITGRPPFVADSPVAVAYQHVREVPQPPSAYHAGIPEVVDRITLHALAKDREARYQTAAEFRGDVEAALAGRSVAASAATTVMAPPSGAATEYLGAPPAGDGYGMTRTMPQGAVAPPTAGPPPGGDQLYARRSDRRDPYQNEGGRRGGFVVLALAVVLLFAGAAYGVSSLVSHNSATASVRVPTVDRLPRETAQKQLLTAKFSVKPVLVADDTIDKGNVIRTDPPGGSSAKIGSQIMMYVSTGAAQTQVPDVKNKTQEEATALLKQAGLTVAAAADTVPGNGIEEGKVVETDPAIGSSVARNTQVTLKLASAKLTVPDVIGKKQAEAVQALNLAGFQNITVVLVPSDQPEGQVLDQDPKKGPVNAKQVKQVTISVASPLQSTSGNGDQSGGDQNGGNQNGDGQGGSQGDQSGGQGDQGGQGGNGDQNSNSVPASPTS